MQVQFLKDENAVRFTAYDKSDLELITNLYNAMARAFEADKCGGLCGVSMGAEGTRLELSLKFERGNDGQRDV